jgi:hypothetical protein
MGKRMKSTATSTVSLPVRESSGTKWWASAEITAKLHQEVSLKQVAIGLKKNQIIPLLLELFAEGKLDALIEKKLPRR